MNTETIAQFDVLDTEMLTSVSGGDGGASAFLIFLGGSIYSYYASEATSSCRKNPKQWHCVSF